MSISPEAQAAEARERMIASIGLLKSRLEPKSLAQDAVQGIKEKSQDIARDGIDVAKKNPAAVAGAIAAIGLFLGRRPIARLFARDKDATPPPAKSSTTRQTSAAKKER